ncbi:hypothetical protein EVAR_93071_1 [Eumeta japonica]|uniref:Uncharacterized protein n=1 Tax=Eumeta variegata TaxID=151549 RepID=A0A4C1TG34_EUMVA|nr:hypothetical protein EVAR_93071_1 [Eumeta japonica]
MNTKREQLLINIVLATFSRLVVASGAAPAPFESILSIDGSRIKQHSAGDVAASPTNPGGGKQAYSSDECYRSWPFTSSPFRPSTRVLMLFPL